MDAAANRASQWAGDFAHTENCLVNFYYYEQTSQGEGERRTEAEHGKCAINTVQWLRAGKK